tara:strand:+ start:285 stop:482 length:198 start_codon:yes stop_codon:yes gene_type:complete
MTLHRVVIGSFNVCELTSNGIIFTYPHLNRGEAKRYAATFVDADKSRVWIEHRDNEAIREGIEIL